LFYGTGNFHFVSGIVRAGFIHGRTENKGDRTSVRKELAQVDMSKLEQIESLLDGAK